MFQPAEGFAVQDAVPVPLIDRTDIAGRLLFVSASGISAPRRIIAQALFLPYLCLFPDRHSLSPFSMKQNDLLQIPYINNILRKIRKSFFFFQIFLFFLIFG